MSVEDWARREAEDMIPYGKPFGSRPASAPHVERIRFADGIVHAFSALLSGEAVEAGATVMAESEDTGSLDSMRAALQAAIQAVTEGDAE